MSSFLAAQSSSRSLVVGPLVGPSVGPSDTFVKKWPLGFQTVTKTYVPSYLYDSSDSSDSCDSSDSSDQNTFFTNKKMMTKLFLFFW